MNPGFDSFEPLKPTDLKAKEKKNEEANERVFKYVSISAIFVLLVRASPYIINIIAPGLNELQPIINKEK